ncbi:unnamed protein product [Eruca vesicaria subsp. sativa]|uniref:RING-type E3 ubiquitin transferase n=1 Tax=Eruca vesicaria subsp. sativa TaxID=29727 RepID=A0ABC8J6W1_ERUVS|nr:unnamed protein product [Eruca vesicaria subsp. sativa]
MPSSSTTPTTASYWCYSCTRFVSVWSESEQGTTTLTVACPHCDGGFIEEVTPSSSASAAAESPLPASTEVRSIDNTRRSVIRRRRSTRRPSFNPVIVLQGGAAGDDSEEGERRRGGGGAFEFYYDDGSGSGLRPLPDSVSEILMGSGFERLLEQLSQIEASGAGIGRSGNPPASKSAIEALPRVEISDCHVSAEESCAVCTEVFEAESEAREMPCKHIFHDDCITPWLSIRNSCPVCRFELAASEGNGRGGEEGGESAVGMTIWRLPGGGFAVGRFNAAMGEGERVLPVVLTEVDGGGIVGGSSEGPRRISWVRAQGMGESEGGNGGGGGSGGRLRRMVRGMVSLMRRVRPNRGGNSSLSDRVDLDVEVERRGLERSSSVMRRFFGRNRSSRDSSVLH